MRGEAAAGLVVGDPHLLSITRCSPPVPTRMVFSAPWHTFDLKNGLEIGARALAQSCRGAVQRGLEPQLADSVHSGAAASTGRQVRERPWPVLGL